MMMESDKVLAPVSIRELLLRFEQEVESAIRTLETALDPVQKECRTYAVEPSPILAREIASNYIRSGHPLSVRLQILYPNVYDTRTWTMRRGDEDSRIPSGCARKMYMEYLYELLEPRLLSKRRVDDVVVATLSRRTFVKTDTMAESISSTIDQLTSTLGRVPDLLEVLLELNPELCADAGIGHGSSNITMDNPFLQTLAEIVLFPYDQGHGSIYERFVEWNRSMKHHGKLTMKVKPYVSRADVRAYYVDKCKVRHFCGSIYQSLIQGRTMREKEKSVFEATMPAKDKHLIDWQDEIREDGFVALTLLDVSSFTNSCVNSWVLALALLTSVISHDSVQHLRGPFKVRVNGRHLTCNIGLLLFMFLYSSVGVAASTELGPHIAPGGYLGVKSNIVATLVFLCLQFDELTVQSRTLFPQVRVLRKRVGGDDSALLFLSPDLAQMRTCLGYWKERLTRFVGKLKEFVIDVFDTRSPGVFTASGLFCKKYLTVSLVRSDDGIVQLSVLSQQKLPFMSELVEVKPGRSLKEKVVDFISFSRAVQRLIAGYECEGALWKSYTLAYVIKHGLPMSFFFVDTVTVINRANIIEVDGLYYLPNAFSATVAVSPLSTIDGDPIRVTEREKRAYLVAIEALTLQRVCVDAVDGRLLTVAVHKSDRPLLISVPVGDHEFRFVDCEEHRAILRVMDQIPERLPHLFSV